MKRTTRSAICGLVLTSLLWSAGAQAGVFLDGRWEGSVDLGEGAEDLVLRLFPADEEAGQAAGGLVDMPARGLFGYPMETLERDAEGLSFTLLGSAPFDGSFELQASPEQVQAGSTFAVSGMVRLTPSGSGGSTAQGPFSLRYNGNSSRGEAFGRDYRLDTGRGLLPGSLLLPGDTEKGAVPLVLLLSGAGADRDGDNWSVPGRSDSLAQLAAALQSRGIASLRYDRRGTGESYRLGAREEELRFDDHIADARAAIDALWDDPRFSSLTVLGHGEGALVGAAALAAALSAARAASPSREPLPSHRIEGLIALCATGRSELEIVLDALSSTPEELRAEAAAILSALEEGGTYPDPSPWFADFFRPSIQPYLASSLRFDPRAALAATPAPVLVIAGGSDLQVGGHETELLAEARGDAEYRVIVGMSHALKRVDEDEEANYSSFTDPALPLPEALPELVAAFARGEKLPGVDPRNRRPSVPRSAPR